MLLCRSQSQQTTCDTPNRDGSQFCQRCGRSLQGALFAHNAGTLIGRYRVLRLIGHGNFGAVYEAEVVSHPHVHVALKESLDPDNIPSFATEFTVLNRLRHLNLPRYYEMFEHGGSGFLAMDFVYGQSLHDIIQRQGGPISEQMVFGYADQICEVVAYLHSHDPPVIHRDIKPQNVLLTSEGMVKLVDFGLVKQGCESAYGTARAGTLFYAPPEQWFGGTDTRSDVYNVGATLYHLLTGHRPMPGIYRYREQPDSLKPPTMINARVTSAVSEVVTRAMSIQPARRFPTICEMHQALLDARRRAVSTRPLVTPPLGTPHPKPATSQLVARPGATKPLGAARLATPLPALTPNPVALRAIRPLLRWAAHADTVNAVAWSPDGHLLSSAGNDGRIALWRIAASSSPPTRVRADTIVQGSILTVAWSPDGRILASGGRATRVITTRMIDGHRVGMWEGHASYINSLAWSPDGELVASAGWEGVVRLWRASDGYLVAALAGHTQSIDSLCWSADSRKIASSSGGVVRIWELGQPQPTQVVHGPSQARAALAWVADDLLVAFGSPGGQIQIHSASSGPAPKMGEQSTESITSLAWSADAGVLASVSAGKAIRLWHRASGSQATITAPAGDLVWHPSGKALAGTGDGRYVQIWEIVYE